MSNAMYTFDISGSDFQIDPIASGQQGHASFIGAAAGANMVPGVSIAGMNVTNNLPMQGGERQL